MKVNIKTPMAEIAKTAIKTLLGFTLSDRQPIKQEKRSAIPSDEPFKLVARFLAIS